MSASAPKHPKELERLIDLSKLDADYSSLHIHLKDLTELASKIAHSSIALINLLDNHTLWTVSRTGIDIVQLPREDSVCQYTILEKKDLEILDLSEDPRFKDRQYVISEPKLRYYYGTPLFSDGGLQMGTLCIFDQERSEALEPEKKELLALVSKEVVNRLKTYKQMQDLQDQVDQHKAEKRKLSHDIRSPLNGIIGVAELIEMKEQGTKVEDILDLIALVKKGGKSIVELANDILSSPTPGTSSGSDSNYLSCGEFCLKLEKLYQPQAESKSVELSITSDSISSDLQFPKTKLIQIAGNLISNSIKFTDPGGKVEVQISRKKRPESQLILKVQDTGIGMNADTRQRILEGSQKSTAGTEGEEGYGFGLSIVKYLIDEKNGEFHIESEPGKGSVFEVIIPL